MSNPNIEGFSSSPLPSRIEYRQEKHYVLSRSQASEFTSEFYEYLASRRIPNWITIWGGISSTLFFFTLSPLLFKTEFNDLPFISADHIEALMICVLILSGVSLLVLTAVLVYYHRAYKWPSRKIAVRWACKQLATYCDKSLTLQLPEKPGKTL